MRKLAIGGLLILCLAFTLPLSRQAFAQGGEPRLALVIGNADYRESPLATPANDAGLVAETLRAAGFQVSGAANLDQDALRRAFREFLAKTAQAGPDAIVFVYLAGRGLQYEGENYFAPIEATIARDADVPIEALRVSDFTRALAAQPLKARIVVLDAARANPFAKSGQPLASGLALVDAEPGALYAFNTAPGTIAPDEPAPYGAYAQALAEMLREGGIPVDEVFSRIRLRVDEVTRGAFVPWDVSKLDPPVVLLPGRPDAPPQATAQAYAASRSRPIREFPVAEAYAAAIERDTLAGYQDFLAVYPNDRLAGRVRALLAARREALTWRRTVAADTPNSYWTYMRRYPRGPHFADARRRLILLSAPPEPPSRFDDYDFGGLPPPPEAEYRIVDRPIFLFDGDVYAPPPPPPAYFLPPRPRVFIELPPPPPPQSQGFLPIPIPIPLPYARPNVPQGVVIQQNFGQQRPAGFGQGEGSPRHREQGVGQEVGQPVEAPSAPDQRPFQGRPAILPPGQPAQQGQPAKSEGPAPAPVGGAAGPGHALPQGKGLPPAVEPNGQRPGEPSGAPAPGGHPQGAKPGQKTSQEPGSEPVSPTTRPSTAPAQPKIEPKGEPSHALPQGKDLPAASEPKGRLPAGPSGAPAPGGHPQGAKPGQAPGQGPGQELGQEPGQTPIAPTTRPSAASGQPKIEPKGAPSHALPQGKDLPAASEPKGRLPAGPSGAPAPGGHPQGAKPGQAPGQGPGQELGQEPGQTPIAPTTRPSTAPAHPKAEPKGAPSHALPQGKEAQPASETKGRRAPPPPGAPAPDQAPVSPATPPAAQPKEKTAPPAAKTLPPAQPKREPSRVPTEDQRSPPSGVRPPHSPSGTQAPSAKPAPAVKSEPSSKPESSSKPEPSSKPKAPEPIAPKAAPQIKPKAPEPEAGRNAPASQQ
ncbi:caspase family protein [Methylocapsa aurea]|uniref:caspase family protein n=1 Tax=Methylocapsa aurea TaxID=663610 RepID=UPI00192E5250|nr:caspase family protein [Methylocapsa aurea]